MSTDPPPNTSCKATVVRGHSKSGLKTAVPLYQKVKYNYGHLIKYSKGKPLIWYLELQQKYLIKQTWLCILYNTTCIKPKGFSFMETNSQKDDFLSTSQNRNYTVQPQTYDINSNVLFVQSNVLFVQSNVLFVQSSVLFVQSNVLFVQSNVSIDCPHCWKDCLCSIPHEVIKRN